MNRPKSNALAAGTASAIFLLLAFNQQTFSQQQQTGVTIQLPTLGVSIDSSGVLTTKLFPDPDGKLTAARRAAALKDLDGNLHKKSQLRKISLRRLQSALDKKISSGQTADDTMRSLAGLQRIEYVFVDPDENDIIIAGPAEGWMKDLAGRTVGVSSGRPTILLEDLVIAIRAFAPKRRPNTWVACSIDPTFDGLQRLKEFQKQIPKTVGDNQRAGVVDFAAKGLRDSLGLADIRIHGIDRNTHMAHVMVEADYRMKLIAMGLEAPPVTMATFIGELKNAPRGMQRWWLTPEYKCVRKAKDGLAVQLVGQGVKLNTENIDLVKQGKIVRKKTRVSNAARKYAASFTKQYPTIAARRPVFAQLRNVIDTLVACAWMQKSDAFAAADWQPTLLLDKKRLSDGNINNKSTRAIGPATKVACVANAVWKDRRLILPAGGGVSIQPSNALVEKNLLSDKNGKLAKAKTNIRLPKDDRWWWD